MNVFPLAIYTADHGLAWNYPRGGIEFQELDACRKAFGPLPDFDAGAKGFSGVWATGERVFIMRCQSVSAWDFRGRNATYLAVTWIPRSEAAVTDFECVLSSGALNIPTKTPPPFFQLDANRGKVEPQAPQPYLNDGFDRIGGVIAATSSRQKVSAKRVEGVTQVTCVVSNPQSASSTLAAAPQTASDSRKPSAPASQALSVPIIACLVIAVLSVGIAVIFGMKAFYLTKENESLKQQLAESQRVMEPQNVFEERSFPCLLPFWAVDYDCSILPKGRIVILQAK